MKERPAEGADVNSCYVNKRPQQGGDHLVHRNGCAWMPKDPRYLGEFVTSYSAVEAAKKFYSLVDGCHWCCPECDRR
jgi:hypothetical protein